MKTAVSSTNSNVVNATQAAKTTITQIPASLTVVPKSEPIVPDTTTTTDINTSDTAALQFLSPNAVTTTTGSTTAAGANNVNNTKRPASLDLNKSQAKKRLVAPGSLVVDSADLPNPKTLNTPDLEKILLSMQTPQPGTVFPSKPGPVTSEQEAFTKGFDEALHSLHASKNAQAAQQSTVASTTAVNVAGTTTTAPAPVAANAAAQAAVTGMSGGSFTYASIDTFPVAIKDEPQNPQTSPSVSPIDMETQEKIKLERKRQRNRVAASKCRKRKLERISKLEEKVKLLKGENSDLGSVIKSLKEQIAQLKQEVIEHLNLGCTMYNGPANLAK